MRSFPPSALSFLPTLFFFTTTLKPTTAQSNPNPILTSSFTWNPNCGPTVACGPSAAGYHGTGFAASNNLTYAGCTDLGDDSVDCSAASIVSGVGKGCGQCWHITPHSDWYPSNGLSVGTSVVVKINDQCTDAGYCDQTEAHPVNTGYGKEVHIDLCAESGVTGQFFGAVGPGVVIGLAQLLPDCSALDDGPYGSALGSLAGASSTASSSSSSPGSGSSSSGSASSESSGSGSSSSSASEASSSSASDATSSSSSSGGGSSAASGGDSSSSSGSDSSSSSGSESSSNSGSSSSSSSGSDSSSNPSSELSSNSGSSSSSNSDTSSSSNSDSSSSSPANSDSSSSSSSNSDSSSSSNPDTSSNTPNDPPTLKTPSTGSGNWTWSGYGTKTAKHKLSSGHDGPKAGANIVNDASNAGSNAADGVSSSSSSIPPPTPTTLVAVVSSSSAPAADVGSSLTGVDGSEAGGDDGDDEYECDDEDDEDVSEL